MTRFGYLVPTREAVMGGTPAAAPLLDLAARAERSGYDSVWVGDSLLTRPRHDPLTLLAAISGRTERVTLRTAVLLPAYRNPVILARYYDVPGPVMRKAQACFGGNAEQTADWIEGFVVAGVEHIVLRFAGDHVRHRETFAELRARRAW